MATAQLVSCIVCDEPVRPRQQGIQCEGCFGWNHQGSEEDHQRSTIRTIRKQSRLGLAAAYSRDDGTYRYIKKLMALPFLPALEIDPAFQRLQLKATSHALKEFVEYNSETWICSTVSPLPPKDWSVYGQALGPIMTSKDGTMA